MIKPPHHPHHHHRTVCDALYAEGISNPLPLQDKCIPHGLREYDVYAMAGKNSGRTLTWAILALDRIEKKGLGAKQHCLEPGVVVLVASDAEAEACVRILMQLNAPKTTAVLRAPLAPESYGAEVAVMTPTMAARLVDDCCISLRRAHMLCVESCSDLPSADAAKVQSTISAIRSYEQRGSAGCMTVAFSDTMTSPVDHVVYANLRIDRVDFQSVVKPLPQRVGTHFTFLQLENSAAKEALLEQLCRVPAMDKIVVVTTSYDLQGVKAELTRLKLQATLTVWDTTNSDPQQTEVSSALQSDTDSVVLMDQRCYAAFDKMPEIEDVAMFVIYDPMVAARVFEDRSRKWKRTCRVFMVYHSLENCVFLHRKKS